MNQRNDDAVSSPAVNPRSFREELLPYSVAPPRLLRIPIAPTCNYNCTFCCWQRRHIVDPASSILPPEYYEFLAKALVRTGQNRIHLTGGEPLALDRHLLSDVVRAIASVEGLGRFYITTNGSLLDEDYCDRLYRAGLRHLTVSIGAATNAKYKAYARPRNPRFSLDGILDRIRAAIANGLDIRVSVPVSSDGIHTYRDLMVLVGKLRSVGVKELGYFKLHKTPENRSAFGHLHNPAYIDAITRGFAADTQWQLAERDTQRVYTDSHIACFVPIDAQSQAMACPRTNGQCGDYCQGSYGIYFECMHKSMFFRACHREFKDKRNEFIIPIEVFERNDIAELASRMTDAWSWTR